MKRALILAYKKRISPKKWCLLMLFLISSLTMIACTGGGIGGSGSVAGGGIGGSGATATAATVGSTDNFVAAASVASGEIVVTVGGNTYVSITSAGPITAKGSIVVNGIEYETTGATIDLAGVNSNATDLQVGMVVTVEGLVWGTGNTGKANVVVFSPNAEGPITSVDLGKSTLEVMGQTILADAQTTIAGLSGNPSGIADLASNDLVEISGLADADGNIQATRITKKSAIGTPIVSGRVSNRTSDTFKINTLVVDYGNAVLSKFGSEGIQVGDFVEVKGSLATPTSLLADTIEKKSPDFKNGHIIIEGFIDSLLYEGQLLSGFAMMTPFGLLRVELTNSTIFSGGQIGQVKVGTRVEVEGTIQTNIVQGNKLTFF